MKLFQIVLIFSYLDFFLVHGGISYLPRKIPLGEWLALDHTQTSETCDIECAKKCNQDFIYNKIRYTSKTSSYRSTNPCNAVIFDESNNICTRTWYTPAGPPAGKHTGLRVAWASSVLGHSFPWFAIDRNVRGS